MRKAASNEYAGRKTFKESKGLFFFPVVQLNLTDRRKIFVESQEDCNQEATRS